jgi:hypothetical protein
MFAVPSFFGFQKAGFGPTYDADAQAFFDRVTAAGGTLSTTEKDATNQLVLDLKANSLWTPMKAIYPMVGASAAACAQNLKSSLFTGTFTSGWTFASTGVTPNGTSAYFNTTLVPSTDLTQNSNHMSFYSRTNNAGTTSIEIGSLNTTPTATFFHAHLYYSDGGLNDKYFMLLGQAVANPVNNTNSVGFFNGNRKNATTVSHFKNGSNIGDLTAVSVALNNRAVYIGAGNINGGASNFSTRQSAFASIGDGLTDTQASNFYTAVQAFQTTLARQV